MSQVRLTKSLYRTIFRWTRNTSVKNSLLALDPVRFGALPDVLKQAGLTPGTLVQSGKEVESLARRIFRLSLAKDKASEAVNAFLSELPRLNAERDIINAKHQLRLNNQKPEVLAHRTFRVGDVLSHKETQIRHTVVGWEVENGVQYLHTIPDPLDAQYTLERGTTTPAGAASFTTTSSNSNDLLEGENAEARRLRGEPATDFEKVRNPHLLRVLNESAHDYFEGFDSITGRYIPSNQLCAMFPNDIKDTDTDIKEKFAKKTQRLRHEKQMRYVMRSVGGMLDKTTERIAEVLARYDIDSTKLAGKAKVSGTNALSGRSNANTSAEEVTKAILEGPYRHIYALEHISKKISAASSSLDSPVIGDRSAFEGISTLGALLIDVEKMLHLRWQSKGHVHFEEEMQHRLDWATSQASLTPEERAPIQQLEHAFEVPIYRLGEVVRTKKWGWKGTIISIHLRPDSPDAAKWDGVANTPSGAEQPFYRVLPDEAEIAEHGPSTLARLVAEENLELVDTFVPAGKARNASMQASCSVTAQVHLVDAMLQTWHVQNRLMYRYFTGFDVEQGRYIPKHKLHFVFPDSIYDAGADAGAAPAATTTATQSRDKKDKSTIPSLKDIPWLPKLTKPTIATVLEKTVNSDEIVETATSSIAEMESNLKNILAAVNAKQVNRLREERHQRAIKRSVEANISGTGMASTLEVSRGHAVAEAVLMEVYRVVKRIFSLCREESMTSTPSISVSPDNYLSVLKIPFPDPLPEFADGTASGKQNEAIKVVDAAGNGYELPPVNVRSLDGIPLLHMSHLSFLLRTARRREDALAIESIMWKVWMTHDNWKVSTEMIQGAQCIQSGKLTEALSFFQNAASMDPTYSEPYNKMAACSLRLDKFEDCVDYAAQSLTLYPLHYAGK